MIILSSKPNYYQNALQVKKNNEAVSVQTAKIKY